jgi:hypothetical protein
MNRGGGRPRRLSEEETGSWLKKKNKKVVTGFALFPV